MAHMIPPSPKEYDEKSNEGVVFSKLQHGLSDDFYVFHSVKDVTVLPDNQYFEREIDFVIANKDKGVLCIEVKAGNGIQYDNRNWYYSNGRLMDHGGPYEQIATAKRVLRDKVEYHKDDRVRALLKKCRFFHAVMFADMSTSDFESLAGLPEEADPRITICAEDMISIEAKINSIFDCSLPWEKYTAGKTELTDGEFKLLLDSVLCPHFKLIPSPKAKQILYEDRMNQLLREQYIVLEFLDEQQTAVINGAAGTGKTMLAVEKARRHSMNGEKVLFLCYNKMLCDSLITTYTKNPDKQFRSMYENVSFATIGKLAKQITGNHTDFNGLLEWLLDCADKKADLGYRHIIVDEGQDFGLIDESVSEEVSKDNCSIIDALQEAALAADGTFYLFYDKYQMIQGSDKAKYLFPDCIENSDCRLTLHKNCRNTPSIARTSITPLKDRKNRLVKSLSACSWERDIKPVIHLINSEDECRNVLVDIISNLENDGINNITLLTQGTPNFSWIANDLYEGDNGYDYFKLNGKKYPFTTCKKFKGLESDAIVLLDLDKSSFESKKGLSFYVGSSRAKHRLECICLLKEDDYFEVVHKLDENAPKRKDSNRMRNVLGSTFGAEVKVQD